MKAQFIEKRFGASRLEMLGVVNAILDEYARQGYVLTVRQIYYQLVARGHVENSLRSYKRMVGLIGDGRLAGRVDWDMVQDRNRQTVSVSHWDSPADIVDAAARSYRIDKWDTQSYHVEVIGRKGCPVRYPGACLQEVGHLSDGEQGVQFSVQHVRSGTTDSRSLV